MLRQLSPHTFVAIKNTLHTNSYKLIQSCDWFTALNRRHQNTPAVLPAQRNGHRAETATAEGEIAKPHFCTRQV